MIGLLAGQGLGPELVGHCGKVLACLQQRFDEPLVIETGGPLEERCTPSILEFMKRTFAEGGAILSGPGGGRYVYELRRNLGLIYKLNPLRRIGPLGQRSVDLMLVRHTGGGVFQAKERRNQNRVTVEYSLEGEELAEVMQVAQSWARSRQGRVTVALKPHGQPELARLWREACEPLQVEWEIKETDLVAYQMLADPGCFDVLVAPDDIGDILADLGGVLMGGRGLTFGACFDRQGHGVYQTNHGSAFDLAGKDCANPIGQLLSLSFLLSHSLGLNRWASSLERAIEENLNRARTIDISHPTLPTVPTSAWIDQLLELLGQ